MFYVKLNIPIETPLLVTLKGISYDAQSKAIYKDGYFVSEGFSNHGNCINEGLYFAEFTSPVYSVLPDSIKAIFGERNRNICGDCVKFDPISGNAIRISYGIVVQSDFVKTIDFRQEA